MVPGKLKEKLEKEGYRFVGDHSAIKICRWARKSLVNNGECYKSRFYGIDSWRCCQMSCTLFNCQNSCIHCWRNLNYSFPEKVKNPNSPKDIIEGCIEEQQIILQGFKGFQGTNMKKFKEAMEPKHFAISLVGEGTLYPKLSELIKELRKRKISTFLVTNGLLPERLLELKKKKSLPTQLYLSLNAPNKNLYEKWHKSKIKNAWKVFNKSLEVFPKLPTRKVIRLTLVRDLNLRDEYAEEFASLIKKASPDFVEVKAYMAVGYARKRLGYDKMPLHAEVKKFAKLLLKYLKEYKLLDEQEFSRVVLLGKDKTKMKIKKSEI